MRIDVVTSLFPGPPRPREGIFAERRWQGMALRGHQVRVIQPLPRVPPWIRSGPRSEWRAYPREEQRNGLQVLRPRYLHLPTRALGNAARFARAALGELDRPDVVFADYAWPAAALTPILKSRAIPSVIHGRGSDVLQVRDLPTLRDTLAQGVRASGHWCAVSGDLVEALDELGEHPGHGRLTPNGVDADLFSPGSRKAARAALAASPDDAPWVVVVGHWIQRKDPLLALEAFATGAPSQARLFLIGRGPLEAALRERSEQADLRGRVEFIGERTPDQLAAWYRATNLLLLTSSREGRPNVVLEAFASGCPVVATAAGGTSELFQRWPDGLVGERTPQAIAAKIAQVLEGPPTTPELLDCVRDLTWERSFAALEEVLEAARSDAGEPRP